MAERTRGAIRATDKVIRELYPDHGIEAVQIATGATESYIRRRVKYLKVKMNPSKDRIINRLRSKIALRDERIHSLEVEVRACKLEMKRYKELFDERV